jgi:hypothetical protein
VSDTRAKPLLSAPPTVINIGLERFATDLAQAGVTVTHVQWQPPARGNARLAALLSKLGS